MYVKNDYFQLGFVNMKTVNEKKMKITHSTNLENGSG